MTWYDPQEIKDQADGEQLQPEFAPEAEESTTEGEVSEEFTALLDRTNAIAAIVATIDNGPEAVG